MILCFTSWSKIKRLTPTVIRSDQIRLLNQIKIIKNAWPVVRMIFDDRNKIWFNNTKISQRSSHLKKMKSFARQLRCLVSTVVKSNNRDYIKKDKITFPFHWLIDYQLIKQSINHHNLAKLHQCTFTLCINVCKHKRLFRNKYLTFLNEKLHYKVYLI